VLSIVPKDGRLTNEVGSQTDRAAELASCSDEALAHALIAGERRAGAELWQRYSSLVFRLMLRQVGIRDEARDLTQEVFCQILRNVRTLRDPSLLRSWVVSVALRTLKWQTRKRRVWAWVGLSDPGIVVEPSTASPDSEAQHLVRQFLRVLDKLGTREQTIFVLRFVEGFGLAEIAEATHVSLATVKRDLVRLAQQVSAMVADDNDLVARLRRREGVA
jgi:RNA polymerase sigma-70 factor (ECF subfamily)